MALGTALASILGIANLNDHVVKDIKTKKSLFTRFVGSEDGSSQGLLLDRLELWINSIPVYPAINNMQDLVLMELFNNMIAEATKSRSVLCNSYFYVISNSSRSP